MMDITAVTINWNEQKLKLKNKFAVLTATDIFLTEERPDAMILRLETKLGKSKEEIKKIISQL
jgi:hypothetical protein